MMDAYIYIPSHDRPLQILRIFNDKETRLILRFYFPTTCKFFCQLTVKITFIRVRLVQEIFGLMHPADPPHFVNNIHNDYTVKIPYSANKYVFFLFL